MALRKKDPATVQDAKDGLFRTFTRRMARSTKKSIVDRFFETGEHFSGTGLTARIVTGHCIEHKIPFVVEYHIDPNPYYAVRLKKD